MTQTCSASSSLQFPKQSLKVALFWDGISSDLLEDVYVAWERGTITDITTTTIAGAVDLGNAALIPPLVNAHTHLEFSHLQHPLTPAVPFAGWIGKTMAERRTNKNVQHSIDSGINESAQAGTALLGEIVTHDEANYESLPSQTALLLFRELIGLTTQAVAEQKEVVASFLKKFSPQQPVGLSPHAPYTVHPELLQQCVKWANEFHLPLTMHLAETEAELSLMKSGTGELVEMLRRFDLWDSQLIEPGTKPLDILRILSQAPRTLLAHCNYLCEEEINFLANEPQMSVVYCPRTHAFFQHRKHRWEEMLDRGVNVALGTDGRGSSPDLSIWKEVQFLGRDSSEQQAVQILRMATVNGWKAFGDPVSLEVGKRADWSIIRPDENRSQNKLTSGTDLISPQTVAESVNHSGKWKPKWWQAKQ